MLRFSRLVRIVREGQIFLRLRGALHQVAVRPSRVLNLPPFPPPPHTSPPPQLAPAPSAAAAALLRARGARAMSAKIHYTHTDEAPMLATYALLPVIKRFTAPAGIDVEKIDISVAARILAQFPERLTAAQKAAGHGRDTLGELGEIVKTAGANIIKLPNVSASVPQLVSAIAELRAKGFDVPPYAQDPKTAEEKDFTLRYGKVLGSAVNPVLREGNSDRRVAAPVKAYAQKNPHKLGAWAKDSKTRVVHMDDGDFFGSEKSAVLAEAATVKIELVPAGGGAPTLLKQGLKLSKGEVVDASRMSAKALGAFFEKSFAAAKAEGVIASLHLKATMMKISDPVMFGMAVSVFFKDVFAKHAALFKELKVNPDNGFNDVVTKIAALPAAQKAAVEADIKAAYAARPGLAMVDSRKGITNLHVPSDIIVDASMPCVVRDSGRMWNADDKLQDTHAIIPDRSYAGIYDVIVRDVQKHGQFDVATMGSTANVGLMAQKAEEYGSHDKTFILKQAGTVRVSDAASGRVIFEHAVEAGDIWRMCQTKDAPVRDWVKLAVTRARASGSPAIFWLNAKRPHDANIITKVQAYLKEHDTKGLDISIATPEDAMATTCARARKGQDTISVTGNVLRDYLTDLFPILELGTSAKMLSIVPMMAGGGMYETGAGGSAPKHVQQFVQEGHLRWDSLGEYLAMAVSLEDLGTKTNNARAKLLAGTLSEAVAQLLDQRKSPSREVKEIDNRGSHFWIALYWAQAVAKKDPAFKALADGLAATKDATLAKMLKVQGGRYALKKDHGLSAAQLAQLKAVAEAHGAAAAGSDVNIGPLSGEGYAAFVKALNAAVPKAWRLYKPTGGDVVDIGGYWMLDDDKANAAMRPCATYNKLVDKV